MTALLAALVLGRSAPVAFVGIDASGSAREFQAGFLRRLRDLDESLPPDAALEIYRFDTQTYEVHVGAPLETKRLIQTVRAATAIDRGQKGTSLLSLARRIDARLSAYRGRPVQVLVLTDCGVENMTTKDHAAVRAIAGHWARVGVTNVAFAGVRPMHREAIRSDFAPLGERVAIE